MLSHVELAKVLRRPEDLSSRTRRPASEGSDDGCELPEAYAGVAGLDGVGDISLPT